MCDSVVTRPSAVTCGLGTRLCVHMYTKLEMVSYATDISCSVPSSLAWLVKSCNYVWGELCTEVWIVFVLQPWWVLKPFLRYFAWRKNTKMALSLLHTFVFSCLSQGFWASIWVLLIIKSLKEEGWVLLADLQLSYMAFALSIAYIECPHNPYLESLPTI